MLQAIRRYRKDLSLSLSLTFFVGKSHNAAAAAIALICLPVLSFPCFLGIFVFDGYDK